MPSSRTPRGQQMTDVVKDKRRHNFFITDNEIIDVYGRDLGVYGFAVYSVLVRMSKEQRCYPAQQYIADQFGISRSKVNEAIKVLERLQLIRVSIREGTGPRPHTSYEYEILHVPKVSPSATPKQPGKVSPPATPKDEGVAHNDTKVSTLATVGVAQGDNNKTRLTRPSEQDLPVPNGTAEPAAPAEGVYDLFVAWCAMAGKDPGAYPETEKRARMGKAKILHKRGYTAGDVRGCYQHLASESWRKATITLETLIDRMGDWVADGRPVNAAGDVRPAAGPAVQETAIPASWRALATDDPQVRSRRREQVRPYREARRAQALSEVDVARELSELGLRDMHPTRIRDLEAGIAEPDPVTLGALAAVLGIETESRLDRMMGD